MELLEAGSLRIQRILLKPPQIWRQKCSASSICIWRLQRSNQRVVNTLQTVGNMNVEWTYALAHQHAGAPPSCTSLTESCRVSHLSTYPCMVSKPAGCFPLLLLVNGEHRTIVALFLLVVVPVAFGADKKRVRFSKGTTDGAFAGLFPLSYTLSVSPPPHGLHLRLTQTLLNPN